MNAWRILIPAAFLLAACGNDPTGSSPPVVHLVVVAAPLETLVDHGWADVNGKPYRMVLQSDSLVVRDLAVPPGEVTIEVRAVDDNESDLRAGTAFGRASVDLDSFRITVPLVPARSDLKLVKLSHSPEAPVAGDLVTISVDVSNEGVGSSGPTVLAVRVGAELQGERFDVPGMAPGQQLRIDRVVELTQAADYQVLAFVDPQNRVPEVINTNNAAIGLVRVGPAP